MGFYFDLNEDNFSLKKLGQGLTFFDLLDIRYMSVFYLDSRYVNSFLREVDPLTKLFGNTEYTSGYPKIRCISDFGLDEQIN